MSERSRESYIEEVIALRGLVRDLRSAMRRAVDEGNVDHLDCCRDGGKFWHDAIEAADTALGKESR